MSDILPSMQELLDRAYQKGKTDMAREVCEIIDCENTEECEDCVFFDYHDDLGQLVSYCRLKEIANGKDPG